MDTRLSRRHLLKSLGTVGAVGASPLLNAAAASPGPSASGASDPAAAPPARATAARDIVRLQAGRMSASFDRRLGTLYAITREGDALGTNFVGNSDNTRGVQVSDTHWTGDLVATVWRLRTRDWVREQPVQAYGRMPRSGRWERESTLHSADSRRVSFDGRTFRVDYGTPSSDPLGIRSFRLSTAFHVAPDHALLWDITVGNAGDRTLEIGELALPFRANDDYAQPYGDLTPTAAIAEGRMPAIQKSLHEQHVFAHPFIAGHSSYVLVQRPRGDAPFLLLHCTGDTSFECIYKADGSTDGSWIGTDLLAVHSKATSELRGWDWNPWVNGHSSLVLEPGERRSYQLRLVFVDDYDAIRTELAGAGNLGLRVLPSMVVQQDTDVHVEVRSAADLDAVEVHSDGVAVESRERKGQATLLRLRFHGRGQKTLRLRHGGGRWTALHFFCVDDAGELIRQRARFMAERQFYRNPADPYHRHHLFLPFDYRRGTTFDDYDEVWEVGGTGDPGFGEPLFLAEKNAHLPSRDEVEELELYVSDCLFKYIQNPDTFEIRASLYWKQRDPSSYSSVYSKARSEATWRTYSYAFAASIYHALYRIGREYDVLTRRTAADYLRLCHRTCLKWFTTGPYTHVGMITGLNAVDVLEDLQREGWEKEHAALEELMRGCNDEFVRDPYPYASEIEIDETGQSQAFFFTRHFGRAGDRRSQARNREVILALQAMRGGNQPAWFLYGNDLFAHPDLRGQISCWHAASMNGLALLTAFEDTGDPDLLLKGYAGTMSVLHNLLPDGMGFGWFKLDPGVFACEPPRTFEGGPGLWAFLRAARAYVIDDPAFGRVGLGCDVTAAGSGLRVVPRDGLRKRVRLVPEGLRLDATSGEIAALTLAPGTRSLQVRMEDSTGVVRTARLEVTGLPAGDYTLGVGDTTTAIHVAGPVRIAAPVGQARDITITARSVRP